MKYPKKWIMLIKILFQYAYTLINQNQLLLFIHDYFLYLKQPNLLCRQLKFPRLIYHCSSPDLTFKIRTKFDVITKCTFKTQYPRGPLLLQYFKYLFFFCVKIYMNVTLSWTIMVNHSSTHQNVFYKQEYEKDISFESKLVLLIFTIFCWIWHIILYT